MRILSIVAIVTLQCASAWITTPVTAPLRRTGVALDRRQPAVVGRGSVGVRVLRGNGEGRRLSNIRMMADRDNKAPKMDWTSMLNDLLLQRAVQTQLFYFQEFRDGHKKQWLEQFGGNEGLYRCHTFGALIGTRSYLNEMLNAPPVENEVQINWGNRFAGGSADNPYINRSPTQHTYTETVHPQKVCQGIMQIREQLAEEWVEDLNLLEEDDELAVTEHMRVIAEQKNASLTNNKTAELMTIQEQRVQEMVTDSIIMQRVRGSYDSTPLRAKNYDVLKKMGTYIAMQNVLQRLERNEIPVFTWFSTYVDVNGDKFDGDHGMGVAEEFLVNLHKQPMRSTADGKDGVALIDPAKLAREIFNERLDIAQAWQDWLAGDTVAQGHTEMLRGLITRSMEKIEASEDNVDTE